jgi:Protein of unknown function (DUF2635)
VPDDQYWQRRLTDGDVEKADALAQAAEPAPKQKETKTDKSA